MTTPHEAAIEAVVLAISQLEATEEMEIVLAADYAQTAVTAYLAAMREAGFVMVPVEPTDNMISAGIVERHDAGVPEAWSLATANIYRAMIAAAQEGE